MKLGVLVAVIVVLLLLVLMIVSGGEHGPMRHVPSAAAIVDVTR